jgi:hypothetical protein
LFTGGMSFRELWVFIQYLPQESWTQTALRDEPHEELELPDLPAESEEQQFGPWSLDNYQLAALIDGIEYLAYMTARAAGDKEYPKPEPKPRPGVRKSQTRELPPEAKAYLEALRAPE